MTSGIDLWRVIDPEARLLSGSVDHLRTAVRSVARTRAVPPHLPEAVEGQLLVVQEAADKETKVAIKDIQQRVLSQLSPMPSNVVDALSESDFYDLLSYLLQQRGQK